MPGPKQAPGEWAVYDTNARVPDPARPGSALPRHHEARLGVLYALYFNEPCYMPEGDARVFLKDVAFKVLDADGRHVPSLDATQLQRKIPTDLPPNQVVADLGELTDEALLTRVAQIAGGHRYSSATRRETLINVLMDGLTPDALAADEDPDDLPADATAKLLEGV